MTLDDMHRRYDRYRQVADPLPPHSSFRGYSGNPQATIAAVQSADSWLQTIEICSRLEALTIAINNLNKE